MSAQPQFHSVPVCHVVQGQTIHGTAAEYKSAAFKFTTPAIDINALVWPRSEPGPAFDVPLSDIMDVLVETGAALKADKHGFLAEALEYSVIASPLPREVLKRSFASLAMCCSTAPAWNFRFAMSSAAPTCSMAGARWRHPAGVGIVCVRSRHD